MNSKDIAIAGLFIALTFITTYFSGQFIKSPVPGGYLNIGDAVIFIAAILFGPMIGFLAGSIGSALSDVAFSSYMFVPGTFVIKGLEGFIAGVVYRYLIRKPIQISSSIIFIGSILIITSLYVFYNVSYFDPERNLSNIDYLNFVFPIGLIYSTLGSLSLILTVKKSKYVNDMIILSAMIIAGTEMILGYYLYEYWLFVYLAIAEIPINITQASISILAAYFVLKSIRKIFKL
ncbi:MAG: ECF transporter S component [Thermoproteota archaeon]|nr:ECF transporter S component [Thermoproteota archaeon]